MNQIIRLVRKEYRLFWSDGVAVGLTFIVPVILTIIFGTVFGGTSSGPRGIRLAIVNESSSPIAKKLSAEFDTMKALRLMKTFKNESNVERAIDSTLAKELVQKGTISAALIFPADMFTDTSIGIKIKLFYDPKNEIEMQMLQGIVQKTIFKQLPNIFTQTMERKAEQWLGIDSGKAFNSEISQTVARYFKIDTAWLRNPLSKAQDAFGEEDSARGAGAFFGNIVQINQQQLVGQNITNPWATRSVGGWAMMFLLFTLTGSATSLFDEKKSGVILRLLASPISRTHILWSKYLFNMSLGMIQLLFLFTVGWLIFDVDIFSNLPNLILVIIAAATACTAFGMLLAAFSKTPQQANGWGTLLILTMSSVGGAWFPTSFMPEYIQVFSKMTIIYWSMEGFMQTLWRGVGTLEILPHLGILFGIAAVINAISVWQFKKGHVF